RTGSKTQGFCSGPQGIVTAGTKGELVAVVQRGEGDDKSGYWTRIGVAFNAQPLRSYLHQVLDDAFIEIGSSGLAQDKLQTIEALSTKSPCVWTLSDCQSLVLAPDVIQVRYHPVRVSNQGTSSSIRSSIWKSGQRGRGM